MKRRTLLVAATALFLVGASPVERLTVYVPLCRSTNCNRRERLLLTECVLKSLEKSTQHQPILSIHDADARLDWSVDCEARGTRRLKVTWKNVRTGKELNLESDFEPGPDGLRPSADTIAGFVVAGVELVK